MKKLLLILLVFAACNNKKPLTLEELQEVKWKQLHNGIDYYHWFGKDGKVTDSISFNTVGSNRADVGPEQLYAAIALFYKNLRYALNKKAPESNWGYLRLNMYEMTRPDTVTITMYIRGDYRDSSQMEIDREKIKAYRRISNVIFVSKEDAKKKFLGDGNQDWSEILKENPLPNSFDVKLAYYDFTRGWLDSFTNHMQSDMFMISDINAPTAVLKPVKEEYFYLEYRKWNR